MMDWQVIADRFTLHSFGYNFSIFVAAAALLLVLVKRHQRLRVLRIALLFAFSALLMPISSALGFLGMPTAAQIAYHMGRFLVGASFIMLTMLGIFEVLLPALRLRPQRILQDVSLAATLLVWALVRARLAGFDLTGLIATSAVITAVVGFSLQDTLGNILGGLALQMDASIEVGDWIRFDGQTGRVVQINWRQTSIETNNWETVVVPNSTMMKSKVTVLGRRLGRPHYVRRWVYFNVDFRHAPGMVTSTVDVALRSANIANVASEPAPSCVLTEFQDSFGKYAIRYYLTDLAAADATDSEVRSHLFIALKRADIALSIPAETVFVNAETREVKSYKREEHIARYVEELRKVELFRSFTLDELKQIAPRIKPAPFAKGDIITRQGATAHWLYILCRGEAEVVLEAEGDIRRKVADLREGTFFGEMGLLTGEPRTATIIARTDVETYRLDKESFLEIVRSRPEIAQDLSHLLAERRTELDAIRENLGSDQTRARLRQNEANILDRIRNFFDLG